MSSDDALHVQTARVSYIGPSPSLDVSRSSGTGIGLAFAPSRGLLDLALEERRSLKRVRDRAEWTRREANLWAWYEPRYLAELRISSGLIWPGHRRWSVLEAEALQRGVRPRREAWWALRVLAKGQRLVLLCWCGERFSKIGHCHRITLARTLAKLGAVYDGEALPAEQPPAIVCRRGARRR